MKRDICFFLPTRKGSQRVKSKNTRKFSRYEGGLLELKLNQLLDCESITCVVLSTNDELSMEVAKSVDPHGNKILVKKRPEHLCLDSTPLSDLIKYVPEEVHQNHIIWGHTTTPFIDGKEYDRAISQYFLMLSNGFDSLISVCPLQNFILDNQACGINYNSELKQWPRTQDLPLLYEINHAMFIASRDIYVKQTNRVGAKPYLLEQDKIKSIDIDWEEDFVIAEAIYDKLFGL